MSEVPTEGGQNDKVQFGYSTLQESAVTNHDRYGGRRLDVSPQVVLESMPSATQHYRCLVQVGCLQHHHCCMKS